MKPILEVAKDNEQNFAINIMEVELEQKHAYWHYHPAIEITCVLKGEGIRHVGDHVGRFSAGDVMITGENLPHDFNMTSPDEKALFLVIQFDGQWIRAFPELHQVNDMLEDAKQGLYFPEISSDLLNDIYSLSSHPPSSRVWRTLAVLEDLNNQPAKQLLCESNMANEHVGNAQVGRMNQVMDFIGQHYERTIQLDELANLTSMTIPSFCRWFKKVMKNSFVTYLNKHRIEIACRHLLNSDEQISRIAQNVGFESLSSFNRAFRKHEGLSPNQFRQKFR